jgi:hypothetical protein
MTVGQRIGLAAVMMIVSGSIAAADTVTQNLPITITGPGGGGGDPTAGLLPANRSAYASWSTAGLRSIGGTPNRTTISATLSPSGGDDTPAIQAALNACPANNVVQLTAGVFRINGNGLNFSTSNCTLRGAGPGNPALNTGINQPQASPGTVHPRMRGEHIGVAI